MNTKLFKHKSLFILLGLLLISSMGWSQNITVDKIAQDGYSSCTSSAGAISVTLTNTTAGAINGFTVSFQLTYPDLTSDSWNQTFSLAASATDTITAAGLDLSAYGSYSLQVQTNNGGASTLTKNFKLEPPKGLPYLESFSGSQSWNLGSYLTWNSGVGRIQGAGLNSVQDTISTAAIDISKSAYYFNYNFDCGSWFNATDTIFIQKGEACTGNFVTVDTIIGGGVLNGHYNTNMGIDPWNKGLLITDVNKTIQFRMVISTQAGSGSGFYMYDFNLIAGNNIDITEIIWNNNDYTYMSNDTYNVKVVVQNMGPIDQDSIGIIVNAYGGTTKTLTSALTTTQLQYGKSDTIDMGTIDATKAGEYELIAKASIPRDDSLDYNLVTDYNNIDQVPGNFPIIMYNSYAHYFTQYDIDGDGFYDASTEAVHWTTDNANVSASSFFSNWLNPGDSATITSTKFGPIPDNAYLAFNYRIQSDLSSGWGLGNNDTISIQISLDNGKTFTNLAVIDTSNCNTTNGYLPSASIDLSPYKGKEAMFRVKAENRVTADQTSWVQLSVNRLHIGLADVSVDDINSSINDLVCGSTSAAFYIDVTNNDIVKAVNVPLTFEITGANFNDTSITVVIPEIAANETYTDTIGSFDVSLSGTYQLNASVAMTGDYDNSNDALANSVTIQDVLTIPYVENFNSNPSPTKWDYSEANWSGAALYTDKLYNGDSESFYSSKIGEVKAGDYMSFNYLINTYDDGGATVQGNFLREGDSVNVYLSGNCGGTWNLVYSVNTSNLVASSSYQSTPNLDLTAYAGQDIRVRIELIKENVTGANQLYVDDFQILSTGDAGVVSIDVPQYLANVAICGAESDSAMVVVQNFGNDTLLNVPVTLGVIFNGESDTTFFSGTTGQIVPGSTDTIYISGFNSLQSGSYELLAGTELPNDTDNSNDGITGVALTVQSLAQVPWSYSGTNQPATWQYYTTSPNAWSSNVLQMNGVGPAGDRFLAMPLLSESDTAIVTLQKVGPIGDGYKLRLSYDAFSYDKNGDYLADYFRPGDSLKVQISSDCGGTFTTIETFTAQNHAQNDSLKAFEYNLDQDYLGENIAVRLLVVKGSNVGQLAVGVSEISIDIPLPTVSFDALQVGRFDTIDVCGLTQEPVYAIISNTTAFDTVTNATLTAVVKATNQFNELAVVDVLTFDYTKVLLAGETDTVLIGTFNAEEPNTYQVTTHIDFDGSVTNNDRVNNFKIWDVADQTYTQNFDNAYTGGDVNSDPNAWKFNNNAFWDNLWPTFNYNMATQNIAANDTAMMYSPKIGPLKANSSVYFNYTVAGDFGIGDKIDVQVSYDCGATFTSIGNINNDANYALGTFTTLPGYGEAEFPMANAEGAIVIVRYVITNINNNTFTATVDNFDLRYNDIEVLGIVNKLKGFDLNTYNPTNPMYRFRSCGSANDSVMVIIQNVGDVDATGFDVNLEVSGTSADTMSQTYTGVIASGARAIVYMGTVNTSTVGQLSLVSYLVGAFDNNQSNDTLGFTVTTQENFDVTYTMDANDNDYYYWEIFDNNNGNNLFSYSSNNGGSLQASYLAPEDTTTAISPKITLGTGSFYLYFSYELYNWIYGNNIINDEIGEVLVSTDCGDNWQQVWSTDVTTGSQGFASVDLSSFAGSTIRVMFRGIKGYSAGNLDVYFRDITVTDYDISELVTTTPVDGATIASGSTLCEGIGVDFNTTGLSVLHYDWELANTESVTILASYTGNTFGYTLKDVDSGTFTVYAYDQWNNLAYQTTWDVTVNPLPTKPIIDGNQDDVSNVLLSEYTAQMDNADRYIWSMTLGTGVITGSGDVGTVNWADGFVGFTDIYVQGYNACGNGPSSDPYLVYVQYLNPQGGGSSQNGPAAGSNNSLNVTAYPNPNNGTFTLQMPDETSKYFVEIRNNQGVVVQRDYYNAAKSEININDKQPGIYHMRIVTTENVYSKSFVIK